MSATPAPSARAEMAIAAFVRGIERRGRVLAWAQCGDPQRADAAIEAASRAFGIEAARLPMTRWPAAYWQCLLGQSALRVALSPNDDDLLSQLSPAPRAALLLRLVAGLDQHQGADVLRVSPEAYRHALYRALHVLRERGIDEAALRALRERLQAQANGHPDRIDASSPVRSLRVVAPEPPRSAHSSSAPRSPRWVRRLLMAIVLLLLVGLGATFWKPAFHRGDSTSDGFEMLSRRAPDATMSAVATVLGGADFDMLADPDGQRIARDADLYAWYAAGAGAADPRSTAPVALPESSTPETSEPDADTQDCTDAASPACASAAGDGHAQ